MGRISHERHVSSAGRNRVNLIISENKRVKNDLSTLYRTPLLTYSIYLPKQMHSWQIWLHFASMKNVQTYTNHLLHVLRIIFIVQSRNVASSEKSLVKCRNILQQSRKCPYKLELLKLIIEPKIRRRKQSNVFWFFFGLFWTYLPTSDSSLHSLFIKIRSA